jgi:ATP-dependent Clp protease adaptor protein ClpS
VVTRPNLGPADLSLDGVTGATRSAGPAGVLLSVAPAEVEQPVSDAEARPDVPWVTIVWNDPVNLMSYVTFVFQDYFGYDRAKAERLMLDVHTKGRAVVSTGTREEMERDTEAMHGYGLWATFSQDRSPT